MGESFVQEEPLTVRLQGLLKDYRPGISIFKELLQNADDAGARNIVFCFWNFPLIFQSYVIDTTWHGKEKLFDQGLAEHQGPALLVHDDSVFAEKDFDSLKSLGHSVKRDDKTTTGKFGLGFNSVLPMKVKLTIGLWMDWHSIDTHRNFAYRF